MLTGKCFSKWKAGFSAQFSSVLLVKSQAGHFIWVCSLEGSNTRLILCMLLYCFLLWHMFQVKESRTVMMLLPDSKWKEIDSFQIKLFSSSEIITALAHWWFSSVSSTDKERLSSAPYFVLLKRERHCTWLALKKEASAALTPEILKSLLTSGGNWKDHKPFLIAK